MKFSESQAYKKAAMAAFLNSESLLLQQIRDHFFQFTLVDSKLTDTIRQFVDSHWILVVDPVELRFSQWLWTGFSFAGVREFTLQRAFAFCQLFEQCRRDGQTVTTGQFDDFTDVTEACAHHYSFIAMLLVVFVNFSHGYNAWIFMWCELFFVAIGFVPVENTANEGRDQVCTGFGTSTCLREGEQQRQVTVDAGFFQFLRSADTLPGRGQFNQDTVVADTCIIVEFDQALRFRDAGFGVIGQTRVNFGRNTARDQLEDFKTNVNRQFVCSINDLLITIVALVFCPGNSFVDQFTVFRNLCCVKNQRRVSRGILRLIQLHCCDIPGICNNFGQLDRKSTRLNSSHLGIS